MEPDLEIKELLTEIEGVGVKVDSVVKGLKISKEGKEVID